MKRISYSLLLGLIALISTSCEKFLEEELTADVSAASYYTTPGGLEDAVDATYRFTKDFWGANEMGATLTVFGTDSWTNGADGSHKFFNTYDSQLNPSSAFARDCWRIMYQAINQANAVVERAAGIEGIAENTKNTRIAEARFLRALYYFTLVRIYGDVHLTLTETVGVQTTANRTAAAEVYKQAIIADLEFAIANLPATQPQYGRATKPAAEFLLGEVYLTRGYKSYAESGDFAKAFNLFKGVIDNYNFQLLDDFAKVFDQNAQQHSEVIWSIQNDLNPLVNGPGNTIHLYFLMEYDVQLGMRRDTENGRPFKRFRPTDYLYGLWNRSIDSRYQKSFKHAYLCNKPGTYKIEGRDVTLNLGDTAFYTPGVEWSQEKVLSKNYQVFNPSEYTERVFLSLAKHIDPKRPDLTATAGSRDWMLMRLANAYLLAAEAAFKDGKSDVAAQYINVIRRRAAWPGKQADMEITAADVNIDFILDERERELAGEMHRWFDLTRTGTLVERVRKHNPQGAANIQDYHVLRPIPQDQRDRTEGGYPQNPGYPQ